MLIVLDDFRIDKVSKMINKIYDSDEIQENLIRSIFIVLPTETKDK